MDESSSQSLLLYPTIKKLGKRYDDSRCFLHNVFLEISFAEEAYYVQNIQ